MSEQAPVETTWVKTHPDEGERVGLSEKNPAHPKSEQFPQGGEVYVAGQEQPPQQVAKTATVLEALAAKRLIEVPAPSRSAPASGSASAPPEGGSTTTGSTGTSTKRST